jgi:hypothetical protein
MTPADQLVAAHARRAERTGLDAEALALPAFRAAPGWTRSAARHSPVAVNPMREAIARVIADNAADPEDARRKVQAFAAALLADVVREMGRDPVPALRQEGGL